VIWRLPTYLCTNWSVLTYCTQYGTQFAPFLSELVIPAAYYSCQPRDSDFGATGKPFRARWTGSSLCTPPWHTAVLSKTVAWASRSAAAADSAAPAGADTPAVLIILVAPDMGPGPAFQAHIDAHPRQCRLLAHVGRNHTRLARPEPGRAWRLEPIRPQFGMNIYAIGNQTGLAEAHGRVFADTHTEGGGTYPDSSS
jgi:hypothetical protein